jgi:hypothetical protein
LKRGSIEAALTKDFKATFQLTGRFPRREPAFLCAQIAAAVAGAGGELLH